MQTRSYPFWLIRNSLLLLIGCLLSVNVAIGGHEGNGGYGVRDSGGKIYSLDLAMRGVAGNPYAPLSNEFKLPAPEERLLDRVLGRQVATPEVLAMVKTKLAELKAKLHQANIAYPITAIIENAANFTWIRHDQMTCLDVNDDQSPYPAKVQLAYRVERNIRFCKEYSTLSNAHKAALIIHELLYAAHREKSKTVDLNGYLFSEDFVEFDEIAVQELREILKTMEGKLKLGESWLQVSQLITASEAITQKFPPAPNTRLCLGLTLEDKVTFWLNRAYDPCKVGYNYFSETWKRRFELRKEGNSQALHNYKYSNESFKVGTLDLEGKEIKELCDKESGCEIVNWVFNVLPPYTVINVVYLGNLAPTSAHSIELPDGDYKVCTGIGQNYSRYYHLYFWLVTPSKACELGNQLALRTINVSLLSLSQNLTPGEKIVEIYHDFELVINTLAPDNYFTMKFLENPYFKVYIDFKSQKVIHKK